MAVAVELELTVARQDEEQLLATLEAAGARATGCEVDQALLEVLAPVRGVEGDADRGRVTVVADGLELVLMDDEGCDGRHVRMLREEAQLDDVCCIAQCHSARLDDLAVDAER